MVTTRSIDKRRLVALISDPAITRQAWGAKALCRGRSTDLFFDGQAQSIPACCGGCPVHLECLAAALVHEAADGHRCGWWGGTQPHDREAIAHELGLSSEVEFDVEIDLRDPAARARHLRANDHTIRAIADELGCTKRTVYRYLAGDAA